MLQELQNGKIVVGIKQLRRAVAEHRVRKVWLADDADPALTEPLEKLCTEAGIPVTHVPTKRELGQACRISVGAAAAGLLAP